MTIPISQLRGMSESMAEMLRQHGIRNSAQLLESCRTPAARQELAQKLGVEPGLALELANRADLARIKGIGSVYSDLLENAGVDTVKELATRNAANLWQQLGQTNAAEQLAGRLPTAGQVGDWVAQARALPRGIEY